jgi:hypothetical protein
LCNLETIVKYIRSDLELFSKIFHIIENC